MHQLFIIVSLISVSPIYCSQSHKPGNYVNTENRGRQSIDNGNSPQVMYNGQLMPVEYFPRQNLNDGASQQNMYNSQLIPIEYFPRTAPNIVQYPYGRVEIPIHNQINYPQRGVFGVTNPINSGQTIPQSLLIPERGQETYAPQYAQMAPGYNPTYNGQPILLSTLQQTMPNMGYPGLYGYSPNNVKPRQVPGGNNQLTGYNNQVPMYYNQVPSVRSMPQPLMPSIDALTMINPSNPWALRDSTYSNQNIGNVQIENLPNNMGPNFDIGNNNNTNQGGRNEVNFANFPIYEPPDFSGFNKNISFKDKFLDKDMSFDCDIFQLCARCEEAATKCEIKDIPKDDKILRTRVCKTLTEILSSISKEIPNSNQRKGITMHTVELA